MKYYPYSVKRTLENYFGYDAVAAMRKPHNSWIDQITEEDILPLCWQYADERAVSLFLEEYYLLETVLRDDYIAYIVQRDTKKQVMLMFMLTEENAPFRIDTTYAKQLIHEWNDLGFETFVLSECIQCKRNVNGSISFGIHSEQGKGHGLYMPVKVSGDDYLVIRSHPCWKVFDQKLISVSTSDDTKEYECLFEPDVIIARGQDKSKETVGKGIESIKRLFLEQGPIRIAYRDYLHSGIYYRSRHLGNGELDYTVNSRNLICEIRINDSAPTAATIVDSDYNGFGRLQNRIPVLQSVVALLPEEMHGYVLQLHYSDGTIRNYYMESFKTREIPQKCEIEGSFFDKEIFATASINERSGVSFSNGYSIDGHLLFYRSYRQLQPEYLDEVLYNRNGLRINSSYRIPLSEIKNHFAVSYFWGNYGECFGPAKAMLDDNGHRLSNVSFYKMDNGYNSEAPYKVCVEPTGLYGFMRTDGSWLAPPIYSNADTFNEGIAKVTRASDGKELMLTMDGKEVIPPGSFDANAFRKNRCPFNVLEWTGKRPDAGHYWEWDDLQPGNWGIMDDQGNVICSPQYTYAVGFYDGDDNHCVVAKQINGKMKWGVIDRSGKETIPCVYPGLYACWGEVAAHQKEEDGLWGLMDYDGNVIIEPAFEYIDEYDPVHQLVSAGEHDFAIGVYSLEKSEFITPLEFDCVDFGDHMMSCEVAYTCAEKHYNYDGEELHFGEGIRVSEHNGNLLFWKNQKCGLMDWNNNILIPPVLENGLDEAIQNYQNGLLVTGSRKCQGLSTVSGKAILPEEYSEIHIRGEFVKASIKTDTNWSIRDMLFDKNGDVVLQGPYRRLYVDYKKGTISVETPLGKEFYRIDKKK